MKALSRQYITFMMAALLWLLFMALPAYSRPAGEDVAHGKGITSRQLRDQADEKYYKEKYPEALDLYIQAMEQASVEGDTFTYIACTGYVGNIYDAYGDDNSSTFYYQKGYEAAKRARSVSLQSNFLSNLVTVYCRMGNVERAKHYYRLLEQTPNEKDLHNYRYFLFYEKARILAAEHRYEEAIKEHREAWRYADANGMKPLCRLFQMSEIGNLYVRCGLARQAVAMGDSCAALSRQIGSDELLVNAYKMKMDAYSQLQATDSARHYRELYFSLNDSVYNIKKFYKARYKLSEFENREHLAEVSTLNERLSLQVYVIVCIAAFLLMVSVFTYLIYRKNRHLCITQRLLIERNNEMEAADKQSRALLEQYLGQLSKTEETGERSRTGAAEPTEGESKAGASLLGDDEEKKLLSRINATMDDMGIISNPDFSLQMLADKVGSNTHYVSYVINHTYNKNFKTLLNERRIREACHKLTDREQYRNYTMQVIYEEVGYKNAVSFIRAFKKVYGMTPSEYQRLALCGMDEE